MRKTFSILAYLFLLIALGICQAQAGHEFVSTHTYEGGVTDRVLLEYYGNMKLSSFFALQAGGRVNLIDNWGLNLLGISAVLSLPWIMSDLSLSLQHERWESWETTENRALFYWSFYPFSALETLVGIAYRAPQFAPSTLLQSLGWSTLDQEMGVVYRFRFRFFSIHNLSFYGMAWNYDHMRLFTYDNIQFSIQPELTLDPSLKLFGWIGTAVKGVSGGLVSWEQTMFSVGMRYDL